MVIGTRNVLTAASTNTSARKENRAVPGMMVAILDSLTTDTRMPSKKISVILHGRRVRANLKARRLAGRRCPNFIGHNT